MTLNMLIRNLKCFSMLLVIINRSQHMKNLIKLLALITTIVPLAGCSNPTFEERYKDSDFDGLYDSIDPNPDDNEYRYVFLNMEPRSEKISLQVDFRNFLDTKFNRDLAKLASLLISFGYNGGAANWKFIDKNVYYNDETRINAGLVQFGFSKLKKHIEDSSLTDEHDIAGVDLGQHILIDGDKSYQIIMAGVRGYPSSIGWYSNLDMGADTEGYYEIEGKTAHKDWVNKKHYKGFDVAANRIYPHISSYIKSVAIEGVEQIVFTYGHSRSGAISNLIGKKLTDNNIRNLVYSFNNPNTTQETDKAVLSKYTNLFSVRCKQDFISSYPFNYMRFDVYGKKYEFDFDQKECSGEFSRVFRKDFVGNSQENINKIIECAKKILPSREGCYEYDVEHCEINYYKSITAATTAKEFIDGNIVSMKYENVAKTEILENDNQSNKAEYPYVIKYYYKPIILFMTVGKAILLVNESMLPIKEFLDFLDKSILLVEGIFDRLIEEIETQGVEIDANKFSTSHTQETTAVGAYFAKELN